MASLARGRGVGGGGGGEQFCGEIKSHLPVISKTLTHPVLWPYLIRKFDENRFFFIKETCLD